MAYKYKRGNKYHAIRTGKSASKKEERRKLELQTMESAGLIRGLACQVPFELIPAQREPDTFGPRGGRKRGKCIEQACYYIADFVYYLPDGRRIVEDVKGYKDGQAYALYVIKRKLMLQRYGIKIQEV